MTGFSKSNSNHTDSSIRKYWITKEKLCIEIFLKFNFTKMKYLSFLSQKMHHQTYNFKNWFTLLGPMFPNTEPMLSRIVIPGEIYAHRFKSRLLSENEKEWILSIITPRIKYSRWHFISKKCANIQDQTTH